MLCPGSTLTEKGADLRQLRSNGILPEGLNGLAVGQLGHEVGTGDEEIGEGQVQAVGEGGSQVEVAARPPHRRQHHRAEDRTDTGFCRGQAPFTQGGGAVRGDGFSEAHAPEVGHEGPGAFIAEQGAEQSQ